MGASQFKGTVLYRVDHDVIHTFEKNKETMFFTDILGVICFLKSSEHFRDNSVKLLVYETDLNLYDLIRNQDSIVYTIFPNHETLPSNIKEMIKKELSGEKNSKDDDICNRIVFYNSSSGFTVKDIKKIEEQFGDIFILDSNKLDIKKVEVFDLKVNLYLSGYDKHDKIQEILKGEAGREKFIKFKEALIEDNILLENKDDETLIKTVLDDKSKDGKRRRSRKRKKSKKKKRN